MSVNAVQNVLNQGYGGAGTYYNAFLMNDTEETKVNGLWYEVLRRQFPFPAFIITPECYFSGNKADLVVWQVYNGNSRPVFVYEGKKATGNQANDRNGLVGQGGAVIQVWDYYLGFMTKAPTSLRKRQFGMAASGRYVSFVSFDNSGGGPQRDIIQADASLSNLTTYTQNINQAFGVVWNVETSVATIDGILGKIYQAIMTIP